MEFIRLLWRYLWADRFENFEGDDSNIAKYLD